jgi:acetyl-CoA carboxylase alpha subunit
LRSLQSLKTDELLERRYQKFRALGQFLDPAIAE